MKKNRKQLKRFRDKSHFATLEQFIRYVRMCGIHTCKQWDQYSSEGKRPIKYPSNPDKFYENWPGWSEALGNKSSKALRRAKYYTYQEYKRLVRSLALKTIKEATALRETDGKVPADPPYFYRTEWSSWAELIGGKFIDPTCYFRVKYLKMDDLIKFIRSEKSIGSRLDYENWRQSNPEFKESHPADPQSAYGKSWPGWEVVLGLELDGVPRRKIRPYEDFKKFIKQKDIRSYSDWEEYCKSGGDRENFPRIPHLSYSKKFGGWRRFIKEVYKK